MRAMSDARLENCARKNIIGINSVNVALQCERTYTLFEKKSLYTGVLARIAATND